MDRRTRHSPEVRERAVWMVFEHEGEYSSQWSAMVSISQKFGCTAETLRRWVRQAGTDRERRVGLSTTERERLKELKRENRPATVSASTDIMILPSSSQSWLTNWGIST